MASRAATLVRTSLFLAALSACGPSDPVGLPEDAGTPPVPAVTSLSPEPGPFNDKVTVTFTTDRPATVFVTTDGSDPRQEGAARTSGPSPLSLDLDQTRTLTFFSRTPEGADEAVRSVQFVRAGGPKGTVAGVVVVGTVAVKHEIALFVDNEPRELGSVDKPQEIPFVLTGLESGQHRLRAVSDRDDDGAFLPVLDDASAPYDFELDLDDPFKASIEGVRIYLGAPSPKQCGIHGTLTHPEPVAGETLRVSALSPSGFGGGGDPTALLSQLQNGYLLFADPERTEYPYALTDLEPGGYVVVPMLTTLGNGGLSMNFIANPLAQVQCKEGEVSKADFAFGPVDLSGTVTLQPTTAPQGFVYGVVAARTAAIGAGVQAVLMPVIFTQTPNSTEYTGNYAGRALRANATFGLRVFTSADSMNPLMDAFVWSVQVLGGQPAHTSFTSGTADVQHNVTVALP